MHKSQTKESDGTLLAMTLCALVSNGNTGLLEGSVESLYEKHSFN